VFAIRQATKSRVLENMKETRSKSVSIPELKALARKHWEEWLPEKVKELRAEGKLDEALHGAARAAQKEIDHLKSIGYQEHEAEEVALPMFILLKPEPGVDGETEEQHAEAAEAEAEYRRHPPPVVVADREREKEEDEDPDYWKR
jgi:hypothetical protein